ncbi:MAG: DUF2442 domain-containing protein [Gemmatimonadaceae bacterium]|nr:DUF2442 domain-containing protein [Gemmatimonadaceae bacterium]
MLAHMTSAKVLDRYRVALEFTDGSSGVVDFEPILKDCMGVLAELRDTSVFAQLRVDDEAGTIVWPNGADIDPFVLHSLMHVSTVA